MTKPHKMKHVYSIGLILLILAGVIGVSHALVFPQDTRCILIDFYDFENDENLYYRSATSPEIKAQLKVLISKAGYRVDTFWGEKTTNPTYIYCDNDADYLKFGVPFMTPASAKMKLDSYVVISKDGVDLDIIAHEISHTELYERIGFLNRSFKIPTWFDEGLAMQVDYRSYYSLDTLKVKSDNFQNLPQVIKMNSYAQFGSGTRKEVMLNYMTAKYEVWKWYSPQNLTSFTNAINDGFDFEEAMTAP